MGKILAGKNVITALDEETAARVETLKRNGIETALAIIRIGENGGDMAYQRGAGKKAEKVGVRVENYNLADDVSQDELLHIIQKLNDDDECHGILLLRPLPPQIDDDVVRNAVLPEKDMDGITDVSVSGVFAGSSDGFPPCTPAGCIRILDYYGYKIESSRAVIIGRSLVVGRPVAMMLMERNATVTVCHSRTPKEDVKRYCRDADIIIVTAGVPKMFTSEFLDGDGEGKVIIDVGIHVDEDGKLCGDVDFESVEPLCDAVTPVPGGVGMTTSSVLMNHVVIAAKKKAQERNVL